MNILSKVTTPVKILIAVFVVLFIIAVSLFSAVNGKQSTGVRLENDLTAQYLDNQQELGTYLSTTREMLGVANVKSEKLDTVLSDAVKGRYDSDKGGDVDANLVIKAITEAYPDLTAFNAYDKVMDQVQSGRSAYSHKQTKLLSMLSTYDTFRNAGLWQRTLASWAGFPSSSLRAQIGSDVVTGAAAETRMYTIVTTSDAQAAYTSGTMPELDMSKNG